jgi:TRAP-type C4-dicarboxylate transport system permease small subunit
LAGLALVAIPASWDYVHFMARESSPVLSLSFQWVFLPFVLLLVALVFKSIWGMYKMPFKGGALKIKD